LQEVARCFCRRSSSLPPVFRTSGAVAVPRDWQTKVPGRGTELPWASESSRQGLALATQADERPPSLSATVAGSSSSFDGGEVLLPPVPSIFLQPVMERDPIDLQRFSSSCLISTALL